MSVPATFFLGAAQALDIDLLNAGRNVNYGIYTSGQNGQSLPVITPDTVLSLEYRGEQRIADYPIEKGGFSSFNKVAIPFDLSVVMVCKGRNFVESLLQPVTQSINALVNGSLLDSVLGPAFGQPMSRNEFLTQLDNMLQSLTLYDVVTPDATYPSVNLVQYSYAKKNDNGAVMIIADLKFREVRLNVGATYTSSGNPSVNSNSPSASDQVNNGAVTFAYGTMSDQALISGAPFQ